MQRVVDFLKANHPKLWGRHNGRDHIFMALGTRRDGRRTSQRAVAPVPGSPPPACLRASSTHRVLGPTHP